MDAQNGIKHGVTTLENLHTECLQKLQRIMKKHNKHCLALLTQSPAMMATVQRIHSVQVI